MNTDPILVLQMQRMGDLVLSFPLLAWLKTVFPRHPLWVVGEEQFFKPLMTISPVATYFSYTESWRLANTKFHLILNLSHRPEAALLAGSLLADELLGPYIRDETQRIRGSWQLYRASIAHNNHYNRYHWSDLNGLDCVPLTTIRHTVWPQPVKKFSGKGRIGLFLGASERIKRPDARFWISLTARLLQMDYHPVLLGGNAEKSLGGEIAKALNIHALNLCGRFNIIQLYSFIQQLDILATPDTGPMHIATWAGTKVVNLSMGSVNPWETGPMSPGHYVVRANVSCLNCWQCSQPVAVCREMFTPAQTAEVIHSILQDQCPSAALTPSDPIQILRTSRSGGLYTLTRLPGFSATAEGNSCEPAETRVHDLIAEFWHAWFGKQFGMFQDNRYIPVWQKLAAQSPRVAEQVQDATRRFLMDLLHAVKSASDPLLTDINFWQQYCERIHPFTGYIQLYAQNNAGDPQALPYILQQCEELLALPLC